jgi:hypothetical protein
MDPTEGNEWYVNEQQFVVLIKCLATGMPRREWPSESRMTAFISRTSLDQAPCR